jgi:hypothetical protein
VANEVEGVIRAGEANKAAVIACRRQNGFNWPSLLFFAGSLIVTFLVSAVFTGVVAAWFGKAGALAPIGCGLGVALSLVALIPPYRRLLVWRFRKRRLKLGLRDQVELRAAVEDGAFHYDCGGVRSQVDWSVITEIFPAAGHWVLSANSTFLYVPKRFFQDSSAERAFLTRVLERMPSVARARSKAAAAFCSSVSS